ncbi:Ankyrin repeat domain containing protein [Pandoravirus salinus]|uniref:Ankyrin repeat domain containing protein n=1 Tax=Pandoravirus salinus TaxID=1349410 RepID=S4W3I6_9VIRU|nr:ankyrin repeat domain [Pandoravirus salinus]AGO85217.1 Ankyrin repeat domain containing protein [Pandoravirus salinus]
MAAETKRETGPRDLPAEIVENILDGVDAGDAESALASDLFSVDAEAWRIDRRCRTTKKRRLVAAGDLAALKYIRKRRAARFVLQDLSLTARGGHLKAVMWLYKRAKGGYPCRAIKEASAGGHIDVVWWLCQKIAIRPGAIDAAVDAAAEGGHQDVVDYLIEDHGGKGTPLAILWAVKNGHADVVRRLYWTCPSNASAYYKGADYDWDPRSDRGYRNAAVTNGAGDCFGLLDVACSTGRADIVDFLWEGRVARWTPDLFCWAANADGIAMIDFIHAHYARLCAGIDPATFQRHNVMSVVARKGSVSAAVAWRHVLASDFTPASAVVAVECGHGALFRFMDVTLGVPIDYRTCLIAAAGNGHANLVGQMLDKGQVVDDSVLYSAAYNGHAHIVKMLYDRGDNNSTFSSMLLLASKYCDADTVMRVRKFGRARVKRSALTNAIVRGRVDLVDAMCDDPDHWQWPREAVVDHEIAVARAIRHPKFVVDHVLDQAIIEGSVEAVDAIMRVRQRLTPDQPYVPPYHTFHRLYFDAIKHLHARYGIAWSAPCTHEITCLVHAVITRGGTDDVRWLYERGLLEPDTVSCAMVAAANKGHLSTVEFLWDRGFRPDALDEPRCRLCVDHPAEDHHAAQAFLREKVAVLST